MTARHDPAGPGHAEATPSSAKGAPSLRYGRFAVTAPPRHGVLAGVSSTPQTGALSAGFALPNSLGRQTAYSLKGVGNRG